MLDTEVGNLVAFRSDLDSAKSNGNIYPRSPWIGSPPR